MEAITGTTPAPRRPADALPPEWLTLRERVDALEPGLREELGDIVAEALEHARFKERVLGITREAIEYFRLELRLLEFDLEATRREREELRRIVDSYRN